MCPIGSQTHDDVIKWKKNSCNWPFVRGIHRSPVNSPHKGQWRGALMFSLICVWINDWVNNREAGDLRRYRAHYDVNVMLGYGSNNTRKHHLSHGIKQRCLTIVIVGLCTIWHLAWPCHTHKSVLMRRHYGDIRWAPWRLKSRVTRLLAKQLIQVKNTEHVKAFHYWHFMSAIHWWPADSPQKNR